MKKFLALLFLTGTILLRGQAEPNGFPGIEILPNSHPPGGRYLFSTYTVLGLDVVPFLIEMSTEGEYLFYKALDAPATDFKIQPNGHYTWFDGTLGKYLVMNKDYKIIDTIAAEGYATNNHELIMFPKGGYMLLADDTRIMDLSEIIPGGNNEAEVTANVVQEFDADKNLVFSWNGFDYFKLSDAASDIVLTGRRVDFIHSNSIEVDTDGNILISSRNLDEITKIHRKTGKILWRMGGKNNQFTFLKDPKGFSHQHDARRLANGNILIFDNGNNKPPLYSRVVEYKVDEIKKTAELVWLYRHTPDVYSPAMGNARRMPDGNTIIGWGFNLISDGGAQAFAATEVDSTGTPVFEFTLPLYIYSYRVFHYDGKSSSAGRREVSGIEDIFNTENKLKLSLYPNPVYGSGTLEYYSPRSGHTSIKLYDALGREVRELAESSGAINAGKSSVSFDGLPAGMYFIRMQSGGESKTLKALIMK